MQSKGRESRHGGALPLLALTIPWSRVESGWHRLQPRTPFITLAIKNTQGARPVADTPSSSSPRGNAHRVPTPCQALHFPQGQGLWGAPALLRGEYNGQPLTCTLMVLTDGKGCRKENQGGRDIESQGRSGG